MSSTEILLNNLMRYYQVESLRSLSEKVNISSSILLNWSSRRSYPKINQINDIAYQIGVEASQLLIMNNIINIESPIWKDDIQYTLKENIGRLRLEKGINERFFRENADEEVKMSYRSFLRYINGQNKNINLKSLDEIAKIFNVDSYELLNKGR